MKKLSDLLNEGKDQVTPIELFNDYMQGNVDIEELVDRMELKSIANPAQLKEVLNNKFTLQMMADQYDIKVSDIKKRISELLKNY